MGKEGTRGGEMVEKILQSWVMLGCCTARATIKESPSIIKFLSPKKIARHAWCFTGIWMEGWGLVRDIYGFDNYVPWPSKFRQTAILANKEYFLMTMSYIIDLEELSERGAPFL
jgi:hypothetical protein